jgi:hypothetical protein
MAITQTRYKRWERRLDAQLASGTLSSAVVRRARVTDACTRVLCLLRQAYRTRSAEDSLQEPLVRRCVDELEAAEGRVESLLWEHMGIGIPQA